MKILISDGIESAGGNMLQDAGHEVVNQKFTPDELLQAIPDFDCIMVRSATKVTKEVIDTGKKLKVIARGGVGLDNIDVVYAKEKGIKILNTPGASSISVAELAIAHMFAVCRFLNLSNTEMRSGKWPKKEYSKGLELTGKTLGIMGIGNIGKEVAKRALGLGMSVIAFDPYVTSIDLNVKLVSKDELIAQSDFISMHMPFIKAEGPSLTAKEFAKMKKGVIVINCARGGVVSEKDLLDALNNGTVAAAGIDVFETEPPSEAQKELINHPRVSVSPHIGASTMEAQLRVGVEIAQKVIEALK
ncbi:MAG: 3-phosphoglycerate dehydrogenase [Ignavibacteria bacterium GWB2_35_12]|nr:MAG: 3-phosphoglycerate dehydrogenase [Ignavibacteria bacterium GWB2_35_12]OGU89748.1 MAG: 3-phosphoglycerate dehydrogenase [Ignavibacteria bacterium RIFOXYA2_FULL_35_10]OGV24005.1 MAG: 3-phosphoglycerate dehydrogenase [Ignavibacteria bacterium RIFOXYC2_FULL_35_21]